jgi:formylglycine-generating enzyme required for sulfatase activity
MRVNHYELLDVPPSATQDDIKAAYRILVQLYHPDRLQHANDKVRQYAEERLKKINAAYTVLSDPVRRADYDARALSGRRGVAVEEEDEGEAEAYDFYPRSARGGRRRRGVDPDMEAAADEWLRRAAEAERAAERQRRAAAEAERQRQEAEARQRRAAQNTYPRAREQNGALILAFAPSLWTTLIRIPEGDFLMGSDPTRDPLAQPNEQPQHRVWVGEYFIGQYPVTLAHYHAFLLATQASPPPALPPGTENLPVTEVSCDDATAFCHWLSRLTGRKFRLPTEAEWEKAGRGAEGRLYPWGDNWEVTRLNADGRHAGVVAVGVFSPAGDSPYGVADMSGNVWEWCGDWYDANLYAGRAGGRVANPSGPGGGDGCVVRGGAFDSSARHTRCAHRNWHYPYKHRPNLGFRIVAEPLPETE